jgi:predicted alpha/beta hydrolase family esterase
MSPIDNANMYGDLTRGQLAKMISQWAEQEMGVKADETAICQFDDLEKAEGDLANYIIKACKMGLMGQGIKNFRPGDKVIRGEFGTVLSRAIWGDKNNGENPYYAKHLSELNEAGIMNNISDPNATEMRGWVMLMLQRAAETVNPSECNDPAVLLACSLGSESCPAACVNKASEEETNTPTNINDMPVAGDLTIAVADYSSNIKSAPSKGTVIFNAIDFKSSEKVVIESVKLQRSGLSDKSVIK